MGRVLGFFGAALIGGALAHLSFSAVVSAWITQTYSHRLFNVRSIPDESQWGPLARLFVEGEALADPRPKILLFGSSVTWGYSWPEQDTFSWHLQDALEAYDVINLALIGRDIDRVIEIGCLLQDAGVAVAASIIELNIFNFQHDRLGGYGAGDCAGLPRYEAWGGPMHYMPYVLRHPWGIEYFRMFWNAYDYPQPEREFSWAELPDSYFPRPDDFAANEAALGALVDTAVRGAAALSATVVVFIAPTLREGIEMAHRDPAHIEAMADALMSMCVETGKAICLDAGLDLPRADFANLTHLNRRGHDAFADWLLSHLPRPAGATAQTAQP